MTPEEEAEERDRVKIRRMALIANSPLAIAKRNANDEPSGIPFLDRENAAQWAEGIAQNAPTVGGVLGGVAGGVAGGAAAGIGAGLGTSLTGPGAIAAGIGAGALGAAGGAGAGGALGTGIGQLVGGLAQNYADDYYDDIDQDRLREESRRAQLLQLVSMI